MLFMNGPNNDGVPKSTTHAIVETAKRGFQEWEGLLKRIDENFLSLCEGSPLQPKDNIDESLAALNAWCQKFEGEATNLQGLHRHDGHGGQKPTHLNFDKSDATLMRCSWCNRPSASLKKCSSCGRAKYVYRAPQSVRNLYMVLQVLRQGMSTGRLENAQNFLRTALQGCYKT